MERTGIDYDPLRVAQGYQAAMSDHIEKTPINFDTERTRLRRERIAARLALTAVQRAVHEARIHDLLWAWFAGRPADCVGFCWPIRAEVDCRPLVLRLIEAGWRAAMPVVVQTDTPMCFRAWWPAAPMTQDPHGIPVPATDEIPAPEVLLVPLVAFDSAGYRLGYGGGYFDRTLAACAVRPLTIGVGHVLSQVSSIYPAPHDLPLDAVVTEAGLMRFTP